jgi:hypothetical protein
MPGRAAEFAHAFSRGARWSLVAGKSHVRPNVRDWRPVNSKSKLLRSAASRDRWRCRRGLDLDRIIAPLEDASEGCLGDIFDPFRASIDVVDVTSSSSASGIGSCHAGMRSLQINQSFRDWGVRMGAGRSAFNE